MVVDPSIGLFFKGVSLAKSFSEMLGLTESICDEINI